PLLPGVGALLGDFGVVGVGLGIVGDVVGQGFGGVLRRLEARRVLDQVLALAGRGAAVQVALARGLGRDHRAVVLDLEVGAARLGRIRGVLERFLTIRVAVGARPRQLGVVLRPRSDRALVEVSVAAFRDLVRDVGLVVANSLLVFLELLLE